MSDWAAEVQVPIRDVQRVPYTAISSRTVAYFMETTSRWLFRPRLEKAKWYVGRIGGQSVTICVVRGEALAVPVAGAWVP
jgi:hypothetical protein